MYFDLSACLILIAHNGGATGYFHRSSPSESISSSESTQSPLGSCLDPCQSSMARKLPGGQQVATGVLVEEEARLIVGKKETDSQTNELIIIGDGMVFNMPSS